MEEGVFLGTEALASGALTRHQLRTVYRRVLPDVYAPAQGELTLRQRAAAAWLWSGSKASCQVLLRRRCGAPSGSTTTRWSS